MNATDPEDRVAASSAGGRAPGPLAALLIRGVRLYQAVRRGRVSPCRFLPSCSVYAVDALTEHGALRGSGLAVRRIARCRPGGGSGVDLVPPARGRKGRVGHTYHHSKVTGKP